MIYNKNGEINYDKKITMEILLFDKLCTISLLSSLSVTQFLS